MVTFRYPKYWGEKSTLHNYLTSQRVALEKLLFSCEVKKSTVVTSPVFKSYVGWWGSSPLCSAHILKPFNRPAFLLPVSLHLTSYHA